MAELRIRAVDRSSRGSLTDLQDPEQKENSGALVEKLLRTLRQ